MKWNFPTKSSYTNSYPQRFDFMFWVKMCSTTIILPHPWKYLQASTLKSYYKYQCWGNLPETLLVPTLKGFKVTRFISNNKIFESILTILALTLSHKTKKLPKCQFILTYALWGPGTPRIWLFIPGTYRNKLISLNKKRSFKFWERLRKDYVVQCFLQANQLQAIGMKWFSPIKSSFTNAYQERKHFWFLVTIILPHFWKYVLGSTKSHDRFQLCGNIAQTILIATFKGFKI